MGHILRTNNILPQEVSQRHFILVETVGYDLEGGGGGYFKVLIV